MVQQGMDLQKMSVSELKVLAYDLIALGEQTQKYLQIVNQMIQQKSKPVETVATSAPEIKPAE
jgi:hypothetical protein